MIAYEEINTILIPLAIEVELSNRFWKKLSLWSPIHLSIFDCGVGSSFKQELVTPVLVFSMSCQTNNHLHSCWEDEEKCGVTCSLGRRL